MHLLNVLCTFNLRPVSKGDARYLYKSAIAADLWLMEVSCNIEVLEKNVPSGNPGNSFLVCPAS